MEETPKLSAAGSSPAVPTVIDLNETYESPARHNLKDLNERLSASALHWMPQYFPQGVMSHDRRSMRCGDLTGRAPNGDGSAIFHLSGDRAGWAYDFATDKSAGPIDLIGSATGLSGRALFDEAARIVGMDRRRPMLPSPKPRKDSSLEVQRILKDCVPLAETLGAHYLSTRGLIDPQCEDLLFTPDLTDFDTARGYCALVAIIRNGRGEPTGGIHRSYLLDDGSGKAKPGKKMLGPAMGGSVRLRPVSEDGHVGIAEGIETALSATAIFDVACWAALSAGGLATWEWPDGVRRVTIFSDAGQAGLGAARQLSERLAVAGIAFEIIAPLHGDDFNSDLLKGAKREEYTAMAPSALPANDAPRPVQRLARVPAVLVTHDTLAADFAEKAKGHARYDHDQGAWFVYNENYWKRDRTGQVRHFVRLLVREKSKSLSIEDKKAAQKLSFINGVERFLQDDPMLAVTSEHWDADPFLLGTPGGTVDLRTGRLQLPNPTDAITRLAAVAPTHTADCPRFLDFLGEATGNDTEAIRFLQQVSGYCLTGDIREHALIFVYGDGGTGKSTFLRVLTDILKDYAVTAPMDVFTISISDRHPTDLAMLRGARLVAASETEEGRAWAETRIKSLTGGDEITARFMRQDFFTYKPQFKLVIVGNHKPALRNVDDAMRRRFHVVGFKRKPKTPDSQLHEKLQAEYPSILRWMIEGCLDWQASGLIVPASVRAETASYFSEQDLFSQWLDDECDVEPDNPYKTASSAELFESWQAYALKAGEDAGNRKRFCGALEKRGVNAHKGTGGARIYKGMQLKPRLSPSVLDS